MISQGFLNDVAVAKAYLSTLDTEWEGKASVLELKEANYNWKQMEWFGWYFEYLGRKKLRGPFVVPGEKFGTTTFDLKKSVNWDLKAHAIQSGNSVVLNDRSAMNASVHKYGEHGAIIAWCETQPDADFSFVKWHNELKGPTSAYEKERIKRGAKSRVRKSHATLVRLLFLRIDSINISDLGVMNQGRNSNGQPRPPKLAVKIRQLDKYLVDEITFPRVGTLL